MLINNIMNPLGIIKKGSVSLKEKLGINPYSNESDINRVLLKVNGQYLEPYDDKSIEFDMDRSCITIEGDKECTISTKPLIRDNEHIYFTRDGLKCTMALNKDTLLSADAYKPPSEIEDLTDVEKNLKGQIEDLTGSKKKLKDMNEAKRASKLLEPQSVDKSMMLAYIGAGVGIGFMIAQYMIQGGF